jgi:hypothetical protein
MSVDDAIRISRRFAGPPGTANGGYLSGVLAARLGEPLEVRLIAPPPVERELTLASGELRDGTTLLLRAAPSRLELEVPAPVDFDRATRASAHYAAHHSHPFPYCFVCGPKRAPGDGLRIFAGRLEPDEPVAAPFVPDASLATPDGRVRREMLWAALDCPGYFGAMTTNDPALLGTIGGEILRDVGVGERLLVMGWSLGAEGRKRYAGTALFDANGELIGRSRQTWIVVSPTRAD